LVVFCKVSASTAVLLRYFEVAELSYNTLIPIFATVAHKLLKSIDHPADIMLIVDCEPAGQINHTEGTLAIITFIEHLFESAKSGVLVYKNVVDQVDKHC